MRVTNSPPISAKKTFAFSKNSRNSRKFFIANYTVYYHTHHTTSVITQYGQTALMEAARRGHTEVVVELVKAKANLDLQNNVCHYSVYTCIYTRTL